MYAFEAVDPRVVRIHAGEHGRPRRDTRRTRTKRIRQRQPLCRESIHVGGHYVLVSLGDDGVRPLLIGHDQNEVGLATHRSTCFLSMGMMS